MMSHRYSAYALTAAMATLWLAAPAPRARAQAPTVKEIQALYDKQDAAVQKRDLAGALAIVAPNIQAKMKHGATLNYAGVKQQLQQVFGMAKTISSSSVVRSVKMKGSTAIARVTSRSTFTMANPQTGKLSTLADSEVTDDSWMKVHGKWLIVASVGIEEHATMDGKPVPTGQ